jgi:hypothetical protein
MIKTITAEPNIESYVDEATRPTDSETLDHFVEIYAENIPKTHGAPKQHATVA